MESISDFASWDAPGKRPRPQSAHFNGSCAAVSHGCPIGALDRSGRSGCVPRGDVIAFRWFGVLAKERGGAGSIGPRSRLLTHNADLGTGKALVRRYAPDPEQRGINSRLVVKHLHLDLESSLTIPIEVSGTAVGVTRAWRY